MSKEFINLDSLNTFDFKLGPSINYTPSQELPEMYFNATAPVMFGKSFFNNWQTLSAPVTFNTLEGAEKERYGIMPNTNLEAIRNSENWTTQKPNINDFWEYRKANYLLTGGSGSGFLGRDVSKFALERAKMGYWSGPYFKISNPLIENMDQIEKDYNEYLQRLKQAKEEVKVNLGEDKQPIAYYSEGIPYTEDGKIAIDLNQTNPVTIKYDGKEIPSHIVPEPMTLEQFAERTKAFTNAGSIARWMLESQAEGGQLSGNALVGALVDTAFDNPLYANNLDDEYAKQTAIQLSLAKYNSGFNIFEDGVDTIGYDIKEIIDRKEPNFDGAAWYKELNLSKEIRESLATKGINEINFIGTNNKDHALFVLQDKLFQTTLQEKVESFRKNNAFFDNFAGDVVGFLADLTTVAVNDSDLAVGVLATVASGGLSAAGKAGSLGLKLTGYTNKAIKLEKLFKKSQTGLKTLAAISTGELPDFLKKASQLKRIGYIGSAGAALNMVADIKDQNNRIAMSMAGLQTDQQFEYSLSELGTAGIVGFGFGTSLYGITQGFGKIKKLLTKKEPSGVVRLETPEGNDLVSVTPTPEAAMTIKETVDESIKATEIESTETPSLLEPTKTIDLDIEGTKYKFREDEVRLVDPATERNTIENAYVQTPEGVYEISKLSLEEAKARAIETKETPIITGETKTREEEIASNAEKFSDKASIKERGREGSLHLAPESSLFNRASGEGSVAYGVRSIEGNQVNAPNDWKRIAITKEEIAAINAEKNKYLKIRKVREITKRSLDILKQIKESGLTKKDAGWFADQEINLTKNINDLLDLEYRAIGEQHKGFAKLSDKNKQKFLELAEKFKDVKKEDFDKLINEEKNLSRTFRKTLKDYIYGKEAKKEALKVKPTDSPLIKKMKENANAVLANRKTKPRSLNLKQTEKAQKAFLSIEFGKKISTEHSRLLTYFEEALTSAGIEGKAFTDSVKILSAALSNLKLNPSKLTRYLKTNADKAFGATMASAFGKEFKYGLKLDNLKLKNLTPAELAQATVRVALHELGHIYSFVLDVDQQIELYKAYSDNVDLDLLQHMTEVDRQLKSEPYGTGGFEDAYLSNVAEFFANMFDSLVYTQTVDAIAKLENNSLLTKFITPLFKYISDVAKKLANNFSKSFFRDLDDTISEMIQTADLVSERSSTDAASIGIMSYKVQNLLPAETTSFEGLLSYRNYLETISGSVFKKAERSNSTAMFKLSDILTELSISEDTVPNIQGKLLTELCNFSDKELTELVTLVDHKNIKEVFGDFTDNERVLNILTIASYVMPNRIEELISAIHQKAGSAMSNQVQKYVTTKSNEVVQSFLEINNISDTYKAKSIVYAIPTLFDEYIPIQDMYRNYTSILDFYNSIQNDPNLKEVISDKIGLFKIKAPQAIQTLGSGYINQFMFLDDILSNIEKTTGIVLDSNLETMSMFMDDNQKAWISMLLDNPNIAMSTVKQLIASHDQPHNIKKPADLLVALSDITTEHSVIKHLLKTYYTETEAKRFTLKDIESKFNDEKFAKAAWEASQNNPTIDGFAKALADLLVDKKKKEIKKTRKIKETPVVEQPTVKEEKVVPEQYVATDLEQVKTTKELTELLVAKQSYQGKKTVITQSELRSKLVTYLKKNWSGIKTDSVDDIIMDVIGKLLTKSDETQKALDSTPDNKGRTNLVWQYVQRTAQEKASKQKRREAKVSPTLVNNEGKDIDVADAKAALEAEKPAKQEQAQNLLNMIESLTIAGKTKDSLLKYAIAKRDNPNLKDNEVAKLIGLNDKQLQNAKAALKKQITMVEGELKLLRDEERPTTPKEAIKATAANVVIKTSNDLISGKEKPKPVSLEEARTKLESARNIKTNIETAISTKTQELPVAMPEVKTEVGETKMFVSGETKDGSIKAGSVLLPEDKVIVDSNKTEPINVSTTKVKNTSKTLDLYGSSDVYKTLASTSALIPFLESTPKEQFEKFGLEKDILISVIKESKTPETTAIEILKQADVDLLVFFYHLTNYEKMIAAIPTKEGVVKKEATLDTTSRLPVIRKPEDPVPKVDPTVIIDKPVINPEENPVSVDTKTGRTKDSEPKVKTGKNDRVKLDDLDKFDTQMMSGESILRHSGSDPKFVKTILLNFHRVTGELRENLGKKLEALPDQFLHFLDKVYDVYSTISNINKEKYGSKFEAINNIFWEYYDIELAKELAVKGTPVEKLGAKTIDEIISFATEKTNQAITSYNTRYNTELPEFTPPPSPHDFEFKATNLTLRYPDKLKLKDGSGAAVSYASAKTIVDITKDMKDLGLGVIIDLEKETTSADEKILLDFLNELATEHTEVFRSTNFIADIFRGSEKENRNKFREALRRISGFGSFATQEGKTLRSINNLLRYLSSFAESGKVMTHQLVKSGTEAFKTWEACHHQVLRSLSTPIRLNSQFAKKVGDAKVGQAVELALIKSLVIDKAPLTKADVEAAVLSVKPDAKPAYINDIFDITNKIREESIRRNKFILDLEEKTEWIKIKDKDGNPVKPENYFPLTVDGRRVSENNKSQIIDEMVRVRTNTILNNEKLDRSIMLAMGWLWDADGNPFSYRNKEGRNQVHIGETGFDADTLSRLEAKAGNRRYAPGTDLRRIPEIGKEADVKFFSYVDPATAQVVICAIPDTVKDLSPNDLLRYRETVQGSTTHFAEQWKNNFGGTKPALQVMMEELLSYKLRDGNYHKYLQKPEAEDNAFLRLFGADEDVQGFAIKNLSWEEVFDSKILKDILRSNPLEAYENFVMRRGFELLVQQELDRQLGKKGFRIYNLFDAASKIVIKAAKGNESLEKDFRTGLRRLAQDYAEYAGRNNPINGSYGEAGDQLARGGVSIIRATSGQRWGLRSLSEAFTNFISAAPEVGFKETINNLFKTVELLFDRRMSSLQKQQLFETVFGIRSYLSEVEDRYLGVSSMAGTPSLEKSWWSRLFKSREDSWKSVAFLEKLGNIGVEIGSVRAITAFSRHIALTKFAKQNAKYILNDAAIRLLSLIQDPVNKLELERLQELSATSEKADRQLASLQKKLARQAGFGGNWDRAFTFQRFNLLDADKLKALKYAMQQIGTKDSGLVNLEQLNAWVNGYISGPIGPVSKEVMTEAMAGFMYALETQVQTDGMISESRGLNRDLSYSSRSGTGKLMRSLLQWSQSFQSNVLQNLQLKKPTNLIFGLLTYATFNYLSELLIEYLGGRDAEDIKKELKDPSTAIYRMVSTIPVLGPASSIFSSTLAGISELNGGTFKGFANPITPPAFSVINAYTSKALNSTGELWRKGGEMSKEEMIAKFGDIIPYNITFNNSPVALSSRFLQEMDILDKQGAFAKYLQLIQKSKNKYSKKNDINTYSNPAILKSKEIENQLRQNREKYMKDTNKFIQNRKNLPRQPITYTNNKGVSTDLANLLEDMSNQ